MTELASVISVVVAAIVAIYSLRKVDSENAEKLTGSAMQMVDRHENEIQRLKDRLEAEIQRRYKADQQAQEALTQLRRTRSWAKILHAEVLESGGTPTPFEAVP